MLYSRKEVMEVRAKQEDKKHHDDLTIDIPNLVAHGEPDEFIISIIHDKDLVHTEHLGRFNVSQRFAVLAALEGDGLTPLIRPGVSGTIRQTHDVVPCGGRGDHWKVP